MKYESTLSLFWAIVWAVVLIGAIVSIFWRLAIFGVIVLASVMFGMFVHDFVHTIRMK